MPALPNDAATTIVEDASSRARISYLLIAAVVVLYSFIGWVPQPYYVILVIMLWIVALTVSAVRIADQHGGVQVSVSGDSFNMAVSRLKCDR
jgi:hypothetical protein